MKRGIEREIIEGEKVYDSLTIDDVASQDIYGNVWNTIYTNK